MGKFPSIQSNLTWYVPNNTIKKYLHPYRLLSQFLPSIPLNRHPPSLPLCCSFLLFHEYPPWTFHLLTLLDRLTCRHISLLICPSLPGQAIQAKELHIIRIKLWPTGSSSPAWINVILLASKHESSFSSLPWSLWGRYMFWLFSEEMKKSILLNTIINPMHLFFWTKLI